ncbi:MAG: SEC-C metal-binding domain-containing protein [Fimbriimonadaceae bacterium]|nr:MAG: SEC-C metal-binding domain-containing protein [Fimbriimonadaceae bacterium]
MVDYLRKLFDTSKRDVESLAPIVDRINSYEEDFAAKSDEELQELTLKFKERLNAGETLEDVLPEAFAAVREASKRTLKMRHFDVQLLGGLVLHQGRIAEMKTGEGKTLVATLPMYLNALTGKGVHLVTVNDYLARRDAAWMGPIYHFLGLTVGIIQGQSEDSDELGGSFKYVPGADVAGDPRYVNLVPCSRREAYLCDIVYGTNHEFGFDYLRDNMAFQVEQLSMRELNYAIIDEVDSILIDEARTPHIISGPSMEDVSLYKQIDQVVRNFKVEDHYTADKKNHSVSMTEEGLDYAEELLDIDNIANEPKLFHHLMASVKAYALFDRDVDYVVRNNEVVIVDENTGRLMFGRRYSDGLHQALEAKEGVPVQRESQTVAVITFQNLFRLYNKLAGMTGTAKTEEDEFRKIYGLDVVTIPTHRPMIRTDHADIIYKTLEAKFRGIAFEILRLYTKQQPVLVGTRSIEMSEKVSARLTPDMLQKLILVQKLRWHNEVKKDTAKSLRDDVTNTVNRPLDEVERKELSGILSKVAESGDPTSDEVMDWFLKEYELPDSDKENLKEALEHGIPHNVLNAKFHEREALIIAEAGRKGGVTIATNMAGRGVDILLGGRIEDEQTALSRSSKGDEAFESDYASTYASYRRGGKERAAPPLPLNDQERSSLAEDVRKLGGVYILGTERHESRRIDNQLRGRSGRQGDPGESRFFVSLEDQLWKIFNANMLQNPLLKAWPPMEQVDAKFLSGMIRKTQERIENHFFEARKHVLEYDDVLNQQREHIYGMRRDILFGKHVREDLIKYVDSMINEVVENCWAFDETKGAQVYDYDKLFSELNEVFPAMDYITAEELRQYKPGEEIAVYCIELARKAYDGKAEKLGSDLMQQFEQHVMLQAVNDRWMEHLQMVDYIREGIGLRGYGQTDPLIAYKRETYDLFQHTLRQIRDQAVRTIYQADVQVRQPRVEQPQMMRVDDAEQGPGAPQPTAAQPNGAPANLDWRKVGRNDPCPCGSGKKFKACHYPLLRQEGKI